MFKPISSADTICDELKQIKFGELTVVVGHLDPIRPTRSHISE